MNAVFAYRAPLELAYTRKARLIVELRDPVTFMPVWDGLKVRVAGLIAEPIVSSSGRFVWFDEKGATPLEVSMDPGRLPYLPLTAAVPPLPPPPPPPAKPQTWTDLRLDLAPNAAYPFAAGITARRGSIVRVKNEVPPRFLPSVDVRLQWIDDNAAGTVWNDAPNFARTDGRGDFVAMVRLAPSQIARADAQQNMRVRVVATFEGTTKISPERPIPFGRVSDEATSFAWDTFSL